MIEFIFRVFFMNIKILEVTVILHIKFFPSSYFCSFLKINRSSLKPFIPYVFQWVTQAEKSLKMANSRSFSLEEMDEIQGN